MTDETKANEQVAGAIQNVEGRTGALTPGHQPLPEPTHTGNEAKVLPEGNKTVADKLLTVDNDPAEEALKVPVNPETGVRNGEPIGGLIPARKDPEDGSQEVSE